MSLIPFTVTVIDHVNNPNNTLANTAIEIRTTKAGEPLAQIYSDESGLNPIPQPGAQTNSLGVFYFYAESEGDFDYKAISSGFSEVINAISHNKTTNRNPADGSAHNAADIGTADGTLATSLDHRLSSEFNNDDKHFISCIPRVDGAGNVGFVDDVDHETLGFSAISKVGDFIMRISYTDTYTQVNNLSITVDDELCKYGVVTGGSVGTSYTDFTAYAQLSGLVDTTAMTFTGSGLFPDGSGVSVSYINDILIIDHDNHAFNQDSVVVNQVYGLSFMTNFGVSQNASQINIIPWTEFEGSLIYDGVNFILDPAKPSQISPTQGGITYAWDGTVNALKVTHPLAMGYVVNVQAELGGYTEYNVEVDSSSSFRVYFYNSNGTQITSPNTNMKLMFSRPSCQVRGKIPAGAKFHIRAGMTPIRSANLGNAAGNNLWVNGVMQKKI